MAIIKKCKHGKGLTGRQRDHAWTACQCQWMMSITTNGDRSYIPLGPDKRHAEAQALRIEADRRDGVIWRTQPGTRFTDVAASYLELQRHQPGARPNTIRTMQSRMRRVTDWWATTPVDAITPQHVRRFIDDMQRRYAPNTAASLYSLFRCVLGHAQDHGLVAALPVPARSRIKAARTRQPNHLTWQECDTVINALPAPYDKMAGVALLTGLRVGELAALTAGDVDLDGGLLHVRGTLAWDNTVGPPKTVNGRRVVALTTECRALLAEAIAETGGGRVFTVPSLAVCGTVMRDTLRTLGLWRPGRGWHAFRHAHQSLLEASGMGIRDAAARLGHGPNFAQTAAYGWAAEAGDPAAIDATLVRLRTTTQ